MQDRSRGGFVVLCQNIVSINIRSYSSRIDWTPFRAIPSLECLFDP